VKPSFYLLLALAAQCAVADGLGPGRPGPISPQAVSPDPAKLMEERIRAAVASFQGTVSVFAKNIDTGKSFELRADEPVRTASTIKLPIMVAVFSAVEAGKASWDEMLTLREEDKVSGSGAIREFPGGTKLPLRGLMNLMIVVSDNTATNLLLDRFTADFVNAEMDKLGLRRTRSLRKVLGDRNDLKPVPTGFSKAGLIESNRRFDIGVSTPREMGILLEKLAKGEVVSREASREMLEVLKRQQYKDGIGRRLPDAWVASKSGALDRLRSDVGIVETPGGRIVLAITVDDMPRTDYSPDNPGLLLISDLTGIIIDGLGRWK